MFDPRTQFIPEEAMSLDVPVALLERARHGEVDDDDFVECVQHSLPYAWQVISSVVADLELAGDTAEFGLYCSTCGWLGCGMGAGG
jgi:hypothetical protein